MLYSASEKDSSPKTFSSSQQISKWRYFSYWRVDCSCLNHIIYCTVRTCREDIEAKKRINSAKFYVHKILFLEEDFLSMDYLALTRDHLEVKLS